MLLKIHSLVIPSHSSFSISLPLSPSAVRSFSQWYLCLFVSVDFILLAWGVIHCLYLSLFSLSLLSFRVSAPLSLLSSKIWHGIETGERLLFFWHTLPFLNQNQLRRNQVITSAVLLLSPSHPFFHFRSRSMKFYTLKRNWGQPVSQKKACKLDLTGDCCINQAEKNKFWSVRWTSDKVCECACVTTCVCVHMLASQSPFKPPLPTHTPRHIHTQTQSLIMWGGADCLARFVVVRYLWFFLSLSSEERNKHRPQRLSVCDLRKSGRPMKQLLHHMVKTWMEGRGIDREVDGQGLREDKRWN